MESVNYEYFDSENDYSKNPNATKHRSLDELDAQIFYPKENICLLLALYVLKYSHG